MHKTIELLIFVGFVFALGSSFLAPLSASGQVSKTWLQLDVGIVGAASKDVLESAMAQVEQESLGGLLIQLDSPGGALDATRSMVKSIMSAPFPVIVWVGPSGARAGSAGAFITLSGQVAAMAPGSNIGAAKPIQASGKDVDKGAAGEKIVNDTIAFMESIAGARNRNVEMARSFVSNSVSITAKEALENKVIDLIAKDKETLLQEVSGREVLVNGSALTLDTVGVNLKVFKRSIRQKFLEILSNPNLFYLLFLAGIIGIGFELTHPGAIFPGVFGAISMLLALIATSVLPVSFGAAALILVGVALLVAESFVPSFGVLGIGGFVAFVIGSVFLVDPGNKYGLRISLLTIAPSAVLIGIVGLGVGYLVLKSGTAKVADQASDLVGQEAVVIDEFIEGRGKVKLNGEIWSATTKSKDVELGKNVTVKVTGRRGLNLIVDLSSNEKLT